MHPEMDASFKRFRVWSMAGLASPQGFLTPGEPSRDPYIYYYPYHNGGSVIVAGKYPLIYHLLLSPISALSKSLNIVQQLYLLRYVSLGLTTLAVVAAWFFARTIFPKSINPAVAISSFLIFLPMHMHINTSVNTDVLVTLFVSLYFLILAKILCETITSLRIITAGGLLILAVLTKPTALFIIPTTAVAIIVYLARRFQWKVWFLALLLIAMGVSTFVGAILFYQISSGGREIPNLLSFANSVTFGAHYFGREAFATYSHTIRWGFLSFWGLFGWASIPIPFSWVRVLWVVCFIVGAAILIFFVKHVINLRDKSSKLKPYQKDILTVSLFGIIFSLIGVYTPIIATQSKIWGPPARYFFPALLPFTLYFYLGFQQLVPNRFTNWTLPVWLSSLMLFDTAVIFHVLLPSIYG